MPTLGHDRGKLSTPENMAKAKKSKHTTGKPQGLASAPGSALSKRDITILRQALRAAECMACMSFNGRQDSAVPERYRKAMTESGKAFDLARRDFTKRLLTLLVK